MAEWYWRAGNNSKAIEAEERAIEALKNKKRFHAKAQGKYKRREIFFASLQTL
jgi:hypothetical protein